MNHVFTLVSDAGETVLSAEPAKVEAKVLEHGPTQVELSWEAKDFKREDAEGFEAVASVWPGTAELVVAKDDALPLPEPQPEDPEDPEGPEIPENPDDQEDPENPGPLPEPEPLPQADAEGELFRGAVTGIRIDKCKGVVTLVALAYDDEEPGEPEDPTDELIVTATPGADPRTLDVVVNNGTHGEVTIDFGDGSETVTNAGDNTEVSSHLYGEPGTYKVIVADVDEAERTEEVEVVVEEDGGEGDGGDGEEGDAITVTGTVSANDPSGLTVDFTIDNAGNGSVTLDFGDGQTAANAGDGVEVASHTYAAAGVYNATVVDDDQPERTGEFTVELGGATEEPGPDAPAPSRKR